MSEISDPGRVAAELVDRFSMPGVLGLRFGAAVCTHLWCYVESFGRIAPADAAVFEEALLSLWSWDGEPPSPEAASPSRLERLVPTDEAGVGLSGLGVEEIASVGFCVSLVEQYVLTGGSDDLVRCVWTALDEVPGPPEMGETHVAHLTAVAEAIADPSQSVESAASLACRLGRQLGADVRVWWAT